MNMIPTVQRLLARAARTDYDTFVEFVGVDDDGRPLIQRPLDRLVWDFVKTCHGQGAPAGVMLPMGFGKTTQFCYRAAWEIGRDLNLLVSVVTDSEDNSKERVELVRRILDRPEYRLVFPQVKVLQGHDERRRFTIQRDGLSKDPTCSAAGVLTGTGTRTNFLLMDDVVTQRNALLEPTNRKRVEEAIRLTWTSRTKIHADKQMRVVWIQTAYHMADAAAILREDPESGWRWLVVRAEEPYEVLTWERWERGGLVATATVACPFPAEAVAERARRMGPTAAARGLGNRPISGEECPFKSEHFEGPEPLPPKQYRRRVMFADPAGDATRLRTGDTDYCAVVAIGLHPYDKCWEVYLAERMRGSPSQQADFIARKAVQANVTVLWQEAVKDEALVEVTQRVLRDRGAHVAVKPEKPTTNKEIRIVQSLEPALAASPPLLRVCGKAFPDLKNEALAFPVAAHDDLLDALAGAYAKAPSGGSLLLTGKPERWRKRPIFGDMIPEGNPFEDLARRPREWE